MADEYLSGKGTEDFLWKGPKDLRLEDDEWDISAEKVTVTLYYQGPREACRSKRPNIGEAVDGYPGKIISVKIPRGQTPDGTLVVVVEAQVAAPEGSGSAAPVEVIYELEWGELLKKIESHPKCGKLKASAAKKWEDWEKITAEDYEAVSGGWSFATWQEKRRRGQEDYPVSYPIARKESKHTFRPTGVGADMYQLAAPPSECGAPSDGWTYFKSKDSLRKEGRTFSRVEEWTGAQVLDDDIFE